MICPSASECGEEDDRVRRTNDHHASEVGSGARSHGLHAAVQRHQRHPAHRRAGGNTDTT